MSKLSWNHLGLCLNALGRPMEAIQAHKRALELDPAFREALANIGQAYKDYGNSRTHFLAFFCARFCVVFGTLALIHSSPLQ